ncbi:MAG: hypothetical protein WAO91_03045 [Candidatus Nitrosotenuis sp.]
MLEVFLEGGNLDKTVHVITAAFSLLLFLVSYRYYRISGRKKFLYVLFAFLFFSASEVLTMLNIMLFNDTLAVSISHFMVLFVLALFFIGTVRK